MKRKSAQFGFTTPLIIAVVGVVIIILAVVAYFLFFSKPKSAPQPQPTQTPTRETSGFTPSQTDETASWKTYTSEFYGYTLRYPSEALLSEEMKAQGVKARLEQVTTITFKGGSLEITGNAGGRGVAAIKSLQITVGGVTSDKFYESERSGVIKAIRSPRNDEIYFTFSLPFDNHEEVDKTFDKILSTFKFLD